MFRHALSPARFKILFHLMSHWEVMSSNLRRFHYRVRHLASGLDQRLASLLALSVSHGQI